MSLPDVLLVTAAVFLVAAAIAGLSYFVEME